MPNEEIFWANLGYAAIILVIRVEGQFAKSRWRPFVLIFSNNDIFAYSNLQEIIFVACSLKTQASVSNMKLNFLTP